MGFDFLDFFGGVAEGASKTLDQQIEAQKEAIKESSSALIRARLKNRNSHLEKVNDVKKEVLPLLNEFNIEDVAYLMSQTPDTRKYLVKKFRPVPKKDRGQLFDGLKEFQNKVPNITAKKLIDSLVPAYFESQIDTTGLVPKTFADVLFGFDPSDKLKSAIKRGAPADESLGTGQTIDLSVAADRGLTDKGKILAFTEPAKDTYQTSQKSFMRTLHSILGGTGSYNEDLQRYVPSGAEDEYFRLAENVTRILTPNYTFLVRKLQSEDPSLGVVGAQEKAKSIMMSNINKLFYLEGSTENSIKAMKNFVNKYSPGNIDMFSKKEKDKDDATRTFITSTKDWIKNNVGTSPSEQSAGDIFLTTTFPVIIDLAKEYVESGMKFADLAKLRIKIAGYTSMMNKNIALADKNKFVDFILGRLRELGYLN